MNRWVVSLVVLWALVVVPPLCMGGAITHACDCAEDSCCPPGCASNDEAGCRHEGGCLDDPCSMRAIRTDHHGDELDATSLLTSTISHCLDVDRPHWARTFRIIAYELSSGSKLPYPPSDVPFLI